MCSDEDGQSLILWKFAKTIGQFLIHLEGHQKSTALTTAMPGEQHFTESMALHFTTMGIVMTSFHTAKIGFFQGPKS